MTATFGEYIKQRRTELGFPLKKVASHLDTDTSTLGKIERTKKGSKSLLFFKSNSRNKKLSSL